MDSATGQLNTDFIKDLVQHLLRLVDEDMRQAYRMLWGAFMTLLFEHWLAITIVLILFLFLALLRASSGYRGMLGSILYNYLYFGILFILGLIKGPEVFVSEYFELLCAIVLYPVCYFTVRIILDKLGYI